MKAKKVFLLILTILLFSSTVCTGVLAAERNTDPGGVLSAKQQMEKRTTATDKDTEDTTEASDPSGSQGNGRYRLDSVAKKGTGDDYYNVTITAYSGFENFSGYVRLSIINNSEDSIAYDTRIDLPEKTEKSFSLMIPGEGYTDTNLKIIISLLDENMNEVYSVNNNDLFINAGEDKIYIGVLSSDNAKLSYLDMDGEELERLKEFYEVELVDLNETNIIKEIGKLSYLIIDDYDTSKLSSGTIGQIENFVSNGGILYLGTGKNEDKTLKGFSGDFIDAEVKGHQNAQMYVYATNDMCDITMADISYGYSYDTVSYSVQGMYKRKGRGVILLSQISFLDPDFYNLQSIDQIMYYSYLDSYNNSGFYYSYKNSNMDLRDVKTYFESIEGLKKISTGGLKLIVLTYVLLIGPVLYLLLKKTNKREYFWVAIPAVTILTMVVIMIYGGKFRLSNSNISNVTLANADGSGVRKTYSAIFSSKSGDISINLKNNIIGVGTILNDYGNYNGRNITDYHVSTEGGTTKISHDGSGSFDKGYFVGLSENHESGSLSLSYTSGWSVGISGTLQNDTEYDFDYVLILKDDDLVVVKGLKSGDKLAVSSNIVYSGYYYYSGDNTQIPARFKSSKKIDYRMLAALFLALDDIGRESDEVIIGITSDYDSFAKGDVNELSYGCIYSVGTIE